MKTKLIAVACLTLFLCLLSANQADATNYTLTVVTQGSGTVAQNPTNTSYPANVTVTLTALPSAGWYFANWSGNASGSVNPLNVTMTGNLVITGSFLAYPTYSLGLVTNGQGGIVVSPSGGSYLSNTVVTATATAASGWVFAAWSGATNSSVNPVSFAVNANGTLTGTFAQLPAFDVEPVSVTNKAGSTVNFTAHSIGTTPLSYEWYFSGGSLTPVATTSTLSLTNISTGEAGTYWVVATNNYGSATSQIVSLTVTNSIGPTNVVSSPNQASLQAAIALGGWVGVHFNGTLTLTNTINITNKVVLDGTGFDAVISGGNAVRLFYVTNGASLTISNLTLANGNCLVTSGSPGTPADGGAIYNNGGTLAVIDSTLANNVAQSSISGGVARGGAIFNNGGTAILNESVIISNSAVGGAYTGTYNSGAGSGGFGGALYTTNGVTTFIGCTITGNLASNICDFMESGLTMGGAVFQSSGFLGITNCELTLNQAIGGIGGQALNYRSPGSPGYGGAASIIGGSLFVENVQFLNNQAMGAGGVAGTEAGGAGPAAGGALYLTGYGSVADSTFSGNQAIGGNFSTSSRTGMTGLGGGIYTGGTLILNRCSIDSNFTQGGAMSDEFVTVGGAAYGGGIYKVLPGFSG